MSTEPNRRRLRSRIFAGYVAVVGAYAFAGPILIGWRHYRDSYQRGFAVVSAVLLVAVGLCIWAGVRRGRFLIGAAGYSAFMLVGTGGGLCILIATGDREQFSLFWAVATVQATTAVASAGTLALFARSVFP